MDPTTQRQFEMAYAAWLRHIESDEVLESSSSDPYVDNEPYARIVALGRPAVPYILSKLHTPEGHFLVFALERIARATFPEAELPEPLPGQRPLGNQGLAEIWEAWWRQRLTPEERARIAKPGGPG